MSPSYILGYWRPWKSDSSLVDSYCNYLRDTSLVDYGVDTVKKYLSEQRSIVRETASDLGLRIDSLKEIITKQLQPINRNLDILVQQQNLTNLLLQDIAALLRIPDSEKERQMKISLGIKYFTMAKKDPDLFDESLKFFLEAEAMLPLDHFVLNRIGYLYLYSPKNLNIEKAIDYFARAAKLAIVEEDRSVMELATILTTNLNHEYDNAIHNQNAIHLLVADSLNKSAYGLYIIGRDKEAIETQRKAANYSESGKDLFYLAKYEARDREIEQCCSDLSCAIDKDPFLAEAALLDPDINSVDEVLLSIKKRSEMTDNQLDELIDSSQSSLLKESLEWAKTSISFSEKLSLIQRRRADNE